METQSTSDRNESFYKDTRKYQGKMELGIEQDLGSWKVTR